ncbi:MAG: hypothetical protein HQL84_08845 [Magnetococcales bacterium]|nr:hypothetical protein [Magnetococcales bacterium]MBF0150138.1 hypothetical protein [Magnetococcales bacterium]
MKTRKAWKKLGRRIPAGTRPERVETVGESVRHLFSFQQTLSEEEYLLRFKDRFLLQGETLRQGWATLEQRLASWMTRLSTLQGPRIEQDWQEWVAEHERLLDQGFELANPFELLALPLPQPDMSLWHEAFEACRLWRLNAILQDDKASDPAIIRRLDHNLRREEEAHPHPFHFIPYWEYYGRMFKALETARFDHELEDAIRIREFHLMFGARLQQRRFTLFLGPTNSGKTYQALQKLVRAADGVYLAPLRLLALEVSETLNAWGIPCNMVTGEERIPIEGAHYTASTIEMLPLEHTWEMAVIDEAQMLGDPERGWAWTQAILGVQAREVCVVGAPESLPAIEKLLRLTGDPWETIVLERMTPLKVLSHPVKEFAELTPGTALIAFSRKHVLGLKEILERKTGKLAAVLYGALPPEVRRHQAHLFASGQCPFLVATDAIGMGLNLPIEKLLFTEDAKHIDRTEIPLTPMEVRQIGGRAGRFGKNQTGWIGTFRIPMSHIRACWEEPPPEIEKAHLAPNLHHLLAMAELNGVGDRSLARLLLLFTRSVKPDPRVYQMSDLDEQITLARITDRFHSLPLETRFTLSAAPVPIKSGGAVAAFELMVTTVARNKKLSIKPLLPTTGQGDGERLSDLENAVKIVNLYSWLHFRFPKNFPQLNESLTIREALNQTINRLLGRSPPKIHACHECAAPLPRNAQGKYCPRCRPQAWRQRSGRRFSGVNSSNKKKRSRGTVQDF